MTYDFGQSAASYAIYNINRFRGVDYANNPTQVSDFRSPDAVNVEPALNGAVRCRNGYEEVLDCGGRINGVYTLTEATGSHTLIHHGSRMSEWKEHAVLKYEVPAEGLTVEYSFIVDSVAYSFTSERCLTSDDVLEFVKDDNGVDISLKINGNAFAVSAFGTGSLIFQGSFTERLGGVITQDSFTADTLLIVYVTNYAGGSYAYRYTNVSIPKADIPPEGLEVVYKLNDNSLYIGGTKYSTSTASSLSTASGYVNVDLPKQKFSAAAGSANVDYSFTENGIKYYFSIAGGLKAGDRLLFDCDNHRLWLNDIHTELTKTAKASQGLSLTAETGMLVRENAVLPDTKSACRQMGNKLYIFTGNTAYVYGEFDVFDDLGNNDGTVYELRKLEDEAYVPTVLIGSSPVTSKKETSGGSIKDSGGGGGTAYENVNLLSDKRKAQFCVSAASTGSKIGSGTGTWYYKLVLPTSPISGVEKIEKFNAFGEWEVVASGYSVDVNTGIITFTAPLEVTPVSGADNYRVTYTVLYSGTTETYKNTTAFPKHPDENFNPPFIHEYSNAEDYQKYVDGTYYTVYKERILLGEDLSNPDNVTVKVKNLNGRFEYNVSGDKEKLEYVTVTAGRAEAEHKIWLPQSQCYAMFVTGGMDSLGWSADASRYVYWRFYTKVIKEGDFYYLDITNPYAIFYTKNKRDDTVICFTWAYFSEATVTFDRKVQEYKDRVNKATVCTKFGYGGNMDRLFVAGCPGMAEYEFWSEVDNPLYFPDLNYACLGDEDTKVMGWSRVNNNQMAIHKNSNGTDPTIYIQTAQLEENGGAVFPVTEGPAGDGVICQRAFGVLNGEPLALSERGVFATKYVTDVAADVRYAVPRSYYINPKLSEMDLSGAEAIVYNGRYYLATGGYVFLADGNQIYSVGGERTGEYSYEWYVWDNIPVRVWFIYNDSLYFGTDQGKLCRFTDGYTDNGEPINCYWMTPALNFGTTAHYKKIKNCIITCAMPTTEFSEVSIDCITDKFDKNVKNYLIDNTSKLGAVKSIATNYKLKRVSNLQLRIRANNAENFLLCDISILYLAAGRYKG